MAKWIYTGPIRLIDQMKPVYYCSDQDFYIESDKRSKRRRLNSTFENMYLVYGYYIEKEESLLSRIQHQWKERAYCPPSGYMYLKTKNSFEQNHVMSSRATEETGKL